MADNIDLKGLEFEIKGETDKAVESLDKLESSLKRIKNTASGGLGLNSAISQIRKFGEQAKNLESLKSINKFARSFKSLEKISNIKISPSIARQIREISEAVDAISPDAKSKLDGLTAGVKGLSGVGKIDSPFKTSNDSSPPKQSTDDRTSSITQDSDKTSRIGAIWKSLTQSMISSENKIISAFGNILKYSGKVISVIGKIGLKVGGVLASGFIKGTVAVGKFIGKLALMPFKKFSEGVKKATTSISKFLTSLGRIAMYRAVRAILSSITSALKEGIGNLYQYSSLMGGTFASSMDRLASSAQYLKNSFGAVASPLINALAPAIDFVIDKVVSLLNILNQLFARLTGASTWTKAVKGAKSYAAAAGSAAGSTKDAADAAKKLQDFTAGFDELNIFDESDSGSGGGGSGGGGGGGSDYGSMFEEVPIDSSISQFADNIKSLFEAQDWAGVGKLLGNKVNEIVDMVPWAEVGAKLGKGINAAFTIWYNFIDTINFDRIGSGVATALNNAMYNMDFSLIGATLSQKWSANGFPVWLYYNL